METNDKKKRPEPPTVGMLLALQAQIIKERFLAKEIAEEEEYLDAFRREWQQSRAEQQTPASGGKAGKRSQKKRQRPPLPDNDMAVLELLETLPERKGLTGKQILQVLDDKKIYIDQSTLTKGIIPRLRRNGYRVKNKRNGAGYYIEK